MTLATRPAERRAFGRRESCIHAMARMHGRPPEPCIVRNFSDGGALLEFNIPVEPPFKFRLVIEAKGFDAECEVRHHKRNVVGVQFVGSHTGRALDDEPVPASDRDAPRQPELRGIVTAISGNELRRKLFGG